MATRISLIEADELSKEYMEHGCMAFSWDLKNFYVQYDELPKGPSKIVFCHEKYLTHMIEKWNDGAEVTKYRDEEPNVVVEGKRNLVKIAAGTYGQPPQEFPKHNGHEFIDLGLPSGILWSKDDIYAPFAWGGVIQNKFSKAKKNVEKRTNATSIQANPSMDAARYNWGGKWRMPSVKDFQELLDNCTWKWRRVGFKITGPNGNSLFFPSLPYTYVHWWPLWASDSPIGEDKAYALFIDNITPTIKEFSTDNYFNVWPVFSENDAETPNIDKTKIVKRGSVKIAGGVRMNYTISGDEVLTVKGDLEYGRDKYTHFPIKNDFVRYKHLVVEEGVTHIGKHLFERAYIESVKLPTTLKILGSLAFAENEYLESVSLAKGLQTIGVRAFDGCSRLKEIVIPDGVVEIGVQAFYACTNLEKVVLPATLKIIERDAFRECKSLKEVVLPEVLESIGENAFYGTSISEIHIPASVKHLSPKAFPGTTNVIETPKSLYYILLDRPCLVGNVQVYGKAYYSTSQPDNNTSETEARRIIAINLRNSAQYEDWTEDCEFGHTEPFYQFIDCEGEKYAVVPATDSNTKEGLNDNGLIIDEDLYKRLAKDAKWSDMK